MKRIYPIGCYLFNGVRVDSGVDPYDFSSLTHSQKKNIVVKLRNTKLMPHEEVKFTDLKKDREYSKKLIFLKELTKFGH